MAYKYMTQFLGNKKSVIIDKIEYKIKKFTSGIKYLDLFGYRFIEQNRRKKSEWGKKAREGHKIMWIIKGRRSKNYGW